MTETLPLPQFAHRLDAPDPSDKQPKLAAPLVNWHRRLTARGDASGDKRDRGANKALRARLKRCAAPGEVLFLPGFQTLFHALYPDPAMRAAAVADRRIVAGLARFAILAARVDQDKADTGATLGRQMVGRDIETPVVSELRARTLLMTADADEALTRWQRLIPLFASQGVNLPQLARAVMRWHEEDTRRQLSFAYFAARATPPRDDDSARQPEAAET